MEMISGRIAAFRPGDASRYLHIDQTAVHRLHRGLGLVGGAELDHGALDVRFDGLPAHMQNDRGVVGGLAHARPFEHFLLAVGQWMLSVLIRKILSSGARFDVFCVQIDDLLGEIQENDVQLRAVAPEIGKKELSESFQNKAQTLV